MKPFQIFVASFFGLFIAYSLVSVGKVYFESGSVSTLLILMSTTVVANYVFYLISVFENNQQTGYKSYAPTFKKSFTFISTMILIICTLIMISLLFANDISSSEVIVICIMFLFTGIYLFRLFKTKKSH
ncbi:hypothetical protein [Macrococcus sp. DPC7161]|uniref:hypothetical protein n=1 Tax=Macrococcus sp. DPC7161 TaxID=2507060 RepID=UPI00100ABC7B|nr:hypothetical protein [Macrococcus sp. DPC7161]RXK17415.1 hypothetical protein ER639_10550 [Macrococcus sp. DPC7161]